MWTQIVKSEFFAKPQVNYVVPRYLKKNMFFISVIMSLSTSFIAIYQDFFLYFIHEMDEIYSMLPFLCT
jgi:hypothetical protein